MPTVWNPNAVQVTIEGRLLGQQYINRFYVRRQVATIPWTDVHLEEACSKAEAFLNLNLAPLLSSQMVFTEIRARVMAPDLAPQFILPVNIQGGNQTQPLPNNVAACMTLSTGLAGRGGRGRMYVGGITRDAVQNSSFFPNFANTLNAAFQSGLLVRFSETGNTSMRLVIYSQFQNNQPRPQALLTDVTAISMRDNTVDSQRRRLPGRGA
jgi:hypothetical protein